MPKFAGFENKIKNNKGFSLIKQKIKYRDNFRLTKTKDGDKYRVSKRIKYKTKSFGINFIRKLCFKPLNIVDLLIKLGVYKHTLSLKLLFVLIPFLILLIIDDFVVSVVITTMNIFCCYFLFSITEVEKKSAVVNGKFDYGKYRYLKSRGETISIILMLLISMVLIIFGHYYLKSLIQLFNSLFVVV